MWGLFGGGINKDETPKEALIREINEELGIKIYNIKPLNIKEWIIIAAGKEYKVKGIYFIVNTDAEIGEMNLTEGQRMKYFTLEEIINLNNTTPAVKELVKENKNLLINN